MSRVRCSLLASVVFFAPVAFAENLVVNPDFSRLITGWSPDLDALGSIEADFAHGKPAAPSARATGTDQSASSGIVSSCIEIDDSANVDLEFNALVATGSAQGLVQAFSDTACADPLDSIPTTTAGPSTDWVTLAVTNTPLPAGTHSVDIAMRANAADDGTPADAYFDHVGFGPTGTLPAAIPIDQLGLSGAWYDPASSGQGFQFSIMPSLGVPGGGALFGAWYTFDDVAGGPETQRWYSLQASLSDLSDSADITIYQNTAGNFDAPPTTMAVPVGTGTLAFDSCTSGTFAYTFDDGRTGAVTLQTLLPMTECFETGPIDVTPGSFGLSGAWYDPATSGQGVLINVDGFEGSVFVGWYTYDIDGAGAGAAGQRWFSAQGNYGTNGSPIALSVYESTGGVFDTDGVATTVQVGTATLNFASCESATLDYTFTDGDLNGRSGTLDLARLGVTPASCALTP